MNKAEILSTSQYPTLKLRVRCGGDYVLAGQAGQVINALTCWRAIIMAWSCSGTTNAELISNLLRNRLINSDVVAAVRALPSSPPPRFNHTDA